MKQKFCKVAYQLSRVDQVTALTMRVDDDDAILVQVKQRGSGTFTVGQVLHMETNDAVLEDLI